MDRFGILGRNIEFEVVHHFTKRVDMARTQTFFRREGNIYDILGHLNELRLEVGECVARQREIVMWKTWVVKKRKVTKTEQRMKW